MTTTRLFVYGGNWGCFLTDLLNEAGGNRISARCINFPCANPIRLIREVIRADIVMRVGVRPGGAGKRLFVLDTLWLIFRWLWRKKTFIYFWIGTDVLLALEDQTQSKTRYFLKNSRTALHFANAPWLQQELLSIGLSSKVVLFPTGKVSPPPLDEIAWAERFTVMAYIPDHRHDFYGGQELLKAAEQLSDIRFLVTAGEGAWVKQKPDNIEFLGHRDDMAAILNDTHVVVRQVRHDAIGGTVREALFYARHAIYSYPIPHTHQVAWADADGLVGILASLRDRFDAGLLEPNFAGREYAITEWSPQKLVDVMIDHLLSCRGETHKPM